MSNTYCDASGQPILRQSFCMFLDVLGFASTITTATQKGTADKLLVRFAQALASNATDWQKDSANSSYWEYKCFTDNVVFGFPSEQANTENEFGIGLMKAIYHQLDMALAGFFVRGGMSFGPLHIGDELVFGQACLDAYKIESEQADFPRIVLDKSAKESMLGHFTSYSQIEGTPHNALILADEDGCLFLNYLQPLADEGLALLDLERHRNSVADKLVEFEDNPKILRKYLWVAKYHNYFVEQIASPLIVRLGKEIDNYKILTVTAQNCQTLLQYMRSHYELSEQFAGKLQ